MSVKVSEMDSVCLKYESVKSALFCIDGLHWVFVKLQFKSKSDGQGADFVTITRRTSWAAPVSNSLFGCSFLRFLRSN